MNITRERLFSIQALTVAVPWLLMALALVPFSLALRAPERIGGDGEELFFSHPPRLWMLASWSGLLVAAFVFATVARQQAARGASFVLGGVLLFFGFLFAL